MTKKILIFFAVLIFTGYLGCTQHKIEVAPVEVKPIHITIDVNVKVDKALDNFFDDIDSQEEQIDSSSATEQ